MSTGLLWCSRDTAIGYGIGIGILALIGLTSLNLFGVFDPHYDECIELSKHHDVTRLFCMDYASEHPGTTGQEILDAYAAEKAVLAQDALEHVYAP